MARCSRSTHPDDSRASTHTDLAVVCTRKLSVSKIKVNSFGEVVAGRFLRYFDNFQGNSGAVSCGPSRSTANYWRLKTERQHPRNLGTKSKADFSVASGVTLSGRSAQRPSASCAVRKGADAALCGTSTPHD